MNPIDLILGLVLAVFVAVGAARGAAGLALGASVALLLRPLLLLSQHSAPAALACAFVLGSALVLLARWLTVRIGNGQGVFARFLGGFGGALAGGVLLLTMSVSLPIGRTEAGQLYYPPGEVSIPLASAVQDSRLFRQGRDILLYPLLDRQGQIPEARRQLFGVLHDYLVVGEPWEGR